MNLLPVDRALSIYETLADRSAVKGTRERLSKHLMKIYLKGEKDPRRLTVHGLSYLRNFDRETDSRNRMPDPAPNSSARRAASGANFGGKFSPLPRQPVP